MSIAEIIDSGILGLTVVAALVGAAGSLLGVVLKDFSFLARLSIGKQGKL